MTGTVTVGDGSTRAARRINGQVEYLTAPNLQRAGGAQPSVWRRATPKQAATFVGEGEVPTGSAALLEYDRRVRAHVDEHHAVTADPTVGAAG